MPTATEIDQKAEYVAMLEEDWRDWLPAMFPNSFTSSFAPHQAEHWDNIWNIDAGVPYDPLVEIINRGGGKSTQVETACVYFGATKKRKVVMYVCGTKEQSEKHAKAIEKQLLSPAIQEFYPELAQRSVGKYGHSQGWSGQVLVTKQGLVIFFVSLESASRGVRWEEDRVDLFILDDVDERHDSAAVTQRKIEDITESLLPAGSPHAITIFAQNLIHRDSIATQLADGRAQFLSTRILLGGGPIPAIRNLTYEKRASGIGHDITGGTPTWDGLSIAKCQALLDTIGLTAFLRECQHEVKTNVEGALFEEWSEIHHLITEDEFANGFKEMSGVDMCRDSRGNAMIPLNWSLGKGQDWGTTVKHPCVTCYDSMPYELHPLSDCHFPYREIVRPTWPVREDPPMPVTPMRMAEIMRLAEEPWQESSRLDQCSVMSHERKDVKDTYVYDQGEDDAQYFHQWKPDRMGGVSQVQNLLAIDWTKPHPFRKYPKGSKDAQGNDISGQPIMGKPRIYFICANGQAELYWDNEGKLRVKPATNSDGFIRARFEIPIYKNKQTQGGEEQNDAKKIDDDFVDAFKGLEATFALTATPMSADDRRERQLPESLRKEAFTAESNEYLPGKLHKRDFALARMKRAEKPKNRFQHIYDKQRQGQ